MWVYYGFLAAIVAGFLVVLVLIGPLVAEFGRLIVAPVGVLLQGIACMVQEIARRVYDAGRRLEQKGQLGGGMRDGYDCACDYSGLSG
jgi:hypothetical protein